MAEPDIRKPEEPAFVHNARQLLMLLPVLGSLGVGVCGLFAFWLCQAEAAHLGGRHGDTSGGLWAIAGSIGLIASALGFGVLGWIVWSKR
jgi:hypothetical protein